jgi:hypothetical protein
MAGGRLLLHAEQGPGDTLQFCRFVPLAAPGAASVLEVQPPLKRLLATLPGVAEIIAQGEALPPHDAQFPLMSLPHLLGTRLETIPVAIPYLHSDPPATDTWRRRLSALGGPARIGLVWHALSAGDAGAGRDGSPPLARLAQLAPLGQIRGAVFVSLQKGAASAQAPVGSVVHLAGALGKPVWVLKGSTAAGAGSPAGATARGIRRCACSGSRAPRLDERRRRSTGRACRPARIVSDRLDPAHTAEQPHQNHDEQHEAEHAAEAAAAIGPVRVIATTTTEQNNDQDDQKYRAHNRSFLFVSKTHIEQIFSRSVPPTG